MPSRWFQPSGGSAREKAESILAEIKQAHAKDASAKVGITCCTRISSFKRVSEFYTNLSPTDLRKQPSKSQPAQTEQEKVMNELLYLLEMPENWDFKACFEIIPIAVPAVGALPNTPPPLFEEESQNADKFQKNPKNQLLIWTESSALDAAKMIALEGGLSTEQKQKISDRFNAFIPKPIISLPTKLDLFKQTGFKNIAQYGEQVPSEGAGYTATFFKNKSGDAISQLGFTLTFEPTGKEKEPNEVKIYSDIGGNGFRIEGYKTPAQLEAAVDKIIDMLVASYGGYDTSTGKPIVDSKDSVAVKELFKGMHISAKDFKPEDQKKVEELLTKRGFAIDPTTAYRDKLGSARGGGMPPPSMPPFPMPGA